MALRSPGFTLELGARKVALNLTRQDTPFTIVNAAKRPLRADAAPSAWRTSSG